MRMWWAVLALVPAVAWGDCRSVEDRDAFESMAAQIRELRGAGVSREIILDSLTHKNLAVRAAMQEGVRLVYSGTDLDLSRIAKAMQNACIIELSLDR